MFKEGNIALKVHKDDHFVFCALVLSMYVLLVTQGARAAMNVLESS